MTRKRATGYLTDSKAGRSFGVTVHMPAKADTFIVEQLHKGQWLRLIHTPFASAEDAQAWITEAHERDRVATVYRVEKDDE